MPHPLDNIVALYRAMPIPEVDGTTLHGKITLSVALLTALRELEESEKYFLPSDFREEDYIGREFDVQGVALPRTPSEFFAQSWADLLAHHSFSVCAPNDFYVRETDYYSASPNPNDAIAKNYKQVLGLVDLLKRLANHSSDTGTTSRLVFLLKEKLEIDVLYRLSDLRDLPELKEISAEFLREDAHTEQRKSVFKAVLTDLLKNARQGDRFEHLLKMWEEFVKRVRDNYQLYVSGFSFEKVREEVESNKLEYTLKLNKVFGEIQNQLLAIPVALLLIGTQMDTANGFSLKNTSIVLGALVFGWFVALLIKNQRSSLDAIHKEICALENKLKAEHAALAEKLMPEYTELEARYKQQKRTLWAVDAAVASILVFCGFLFAIYAGFFNMGIPTRF